MPKTNDGWNVIKLPGEGLVTSSGVVADDFCVDEDDILSNTSSDDYADMSNPFNMSRKDVEQLGAVSNSFDTLTGSKESSSIRNELNGTKRKTSAKDILSRFETLRKPEIKIWHVALLSSLVTILVLVGSQKYLKLFDGILHQNDTVSVTHNSSNKDLIYSDINFLNHDEPMSPTWRPTGQYYVDFDNHIAYPLPSKELLGWEKFKTDSVILWYTVKSKYRIFLRSDAVTNFKSGYHRFSDSMSQDAVWIRNKLILTKRLLGEKFKENLPQFKRGLIDKWLKLQNHCKILRTNLAETCRVGSLRLKQATESKLQGFYDSTSKLLSKRGKTVLNTFSNLRSYIMGKELPKMDGFPDDLMKNCKKWSKLSDKNARIFFSRFQRNLHKKKSHLIAERVASNLKACEQVFRKRFKCWQPSRFKISRG
ncbi:Atg39p TDEL_0F01560 [Torulaspora delbrueckii]|uniref:Uncharacterized protein n=1 Tax=Torulaspora delbrueckii TaxID=4950 RepID=G8ZWH3_TORDE|nr:hypothetical protein TDEL_0F01560 [Torulaspora delbrueckii]CCE92967.1 hypothetical protein TDEL_0F01560 [Torulaspora delbrueckii]